MANATPDQPMFAAAGELARIGSRLRMRRPVGVPLESNRGDRDVRREGQSGLERIVPPLPISKAKPPAVIVDDDADMIRIFESLRAARERGLLEPPLRRRRLPNEPGEIAPIGRIAGLSARRCEIELIPPA